MLGDALDTERVDADYNAGVLRLRIPLAEQAKPRKITVTSNDAISPGKQPKSINA